MCWRGGSKPGGIAYATRRGMAPRHPVHTDRASDGRIYSAQACGLSAWTLGEGWLAFFRSLPPETSRQAPLPGAGRGAASRTAEERGLDVDNWVRRRQWTAVAGAALVAVMAAGCASGDAALASAKVSQAERGVNEAKQSNAGVTAPRRAQDGRGQADGGPGRGRQGRAQRGHSPGRSGPGRCRLRARPRVQCASQEDRR